MSGQSRERWVRSLVKVITYRVVIVVLNFLAIYVFTGRYDIAVEFSIVSALYTSTLYYVHERIWSRVPWGIVEP